MQPYSECEGKGIQDEFFIKCPQAPLLLHLKSVENTIIYIISSTDYITSRYPTLLIPLNINSVPLPNGYMSKEDILVCSIDNVKNRNTISNQSHEIPFHNFIPFIVAV